MKKTIIVLASFLVMTVGLSASAQNGFEGDEVKDLAQEIMDRVDNEKFDKGTLRRVRRHLLTALDEMDDAGGSFQFSCAARDDDNNRPWMIAQLGKKIAGTVIGSKAECLRVIDARVEVRRGTLVCGSRDNDGNRPYSVVAISEEGDSLDLRAVGDLKGCLKALEDTRVAGRFSKTCVSRDNDGNRPYVVATYNARTHEVSFSGDMGDYKECVSNF